MASFSAIKAQIMSVIPVDQRVLEEQTIDLAIRGAIESISGIYRWEWRERSTTLTLTSGTCTYTMPSDCDMISGKEGVLVDSSGNPTKNRLIHMTEFHFNQDYIENNTDDAAEEAGTPEFYVPLVDRSGMGGIQIRFYKCPDDTYTAKLYYFAKPTENDAANTAAHLIVTSLLSGMSRYIGEAAAERAMRQHYIFLEQLKPDNVKATSSVPLIIQDRYWRNHNLSMRSRQGRK